MKIRSLVAGLLLLSGAALAQSIGGGSGSPVGPAGGDLGNTYPNPSVVQVNGNAPGGSCGPGEYPNGLDSSARPINCAAPAGTGTVTQVDAGLGLGVSAGVQGGNITTTGTIFQITPYTEKTTDYTFANADGASLFAMNAGTAKAFTFPQATATGNFAAGWCQNVLNLGAGALTVQATTSTITPTLPTLGKGQFVPICSDGTNYHAVGLTLSQIAADSVVINASASTAFPTAAALTSCSGASSALTYNTSTHAFGCNTITASAPAYGFAVSNNATSLPSQATGTAIQFASADTVSSVLFGNSFAASSGLIGQRANGTNASPTTLAANDPIAFLSGRGYDGSAYTSSSAGNFQIQALEAWTGSAHGTGLVGQCTPLLSTTIAECIKVAATGLVLGSSTANQAPRAGVDIGSNLKATGFKIFNVDGTNSEDGFCFWLSNVFRCGTEKSGSGSARQMTLLSATALNLSSASGTNVNIQVASSTVAHVQSTGLFMDAGQMVMKGFAVASLPTGIQGGVAFVTDANAACSFGATPTGGGSTVCKVWYNGTAWIEG